MNTFTNSVGQTLEPGDKVVALGKSWGRISTYIGEYIGVSKSNNPQVRISTKHYMYVHKETGEEAYWPYVDTTGCKTWAERQELRDKEMKNWECVERYGTAIRTLQLGRVYKLAA